MQRRPGKTIICGLQDIHRCEPESLEPCAANRRGELQPKSQMIQARVTAIIPSRNGGDAKAFARSPSLISSENPNGELMFYVAPPFWTGGRAPYVGQNLMVGHIERQTNLHWRQPRWLARDVSPEQAIKRFAPNRLQEPTILSTQPEAGLIGRFLALIGLRSCNTPKLG